MLNRILALSLFLILFGLCFGVPTLFADGGDQVIVAHAITVYPESIQEVATDRTIRLTKDRFDVVKKFYESRKIAGDRLEPFKNGNETGINLVYHKAINGKDMSVLEVMFTAKIPDTNYHPALGELRAQVAMGKHSEAQYKVFYNKYKDLHLAYFRLVEDDQGRSASEGEVIYRKAYNAAHPKLNKGSDSERAAGKAKSQELKKQMQDMKAKGDFAGMMQLAQQGDKSPGQTTAGASAMAAMKQDTWDLWVKCLADINEAAYWTRLQYNGNALAE